MLSISDVSFSYGDRRILSEISFSSRKGEVTSILGPNGVGKTTLMNCLCNFNRTWDGTISVDDKDVRSLSNRELAKNIGYVPQKSVAKRATVFDSVLIGRRPYIEWSATKEDNEITWAAIESMGLQRIALRYVDEISGGEFQKVQIARAMVQQPKVMMLDEPTNNLDIANQHMTMDNILHAVEESNVCTLMTMHDINLSIMYSDKLLFMKDGRVMAFGGSDIVTEDLILEVYGMRTKVLTHEGVPFVLPIREGRSRRGDL